MSMLGVGEKSRPASHGRYIEIVSGWGRMYRERSKES